MSSSRKKPRPRGRPKGSAAAASSYRLRLGPITSATLEDRASEFTRLRLPHEYVRLFIACELWALEEQGRPKGEAQQLVAKRWGISDRSVRDIRKKIQDSLELKSGTRLTEADYIRAVIAMLQQLTRKSAFRKLMRYLDPDGYFGEGNASIISANTPPRSD